MSDPSMTEPAGTSDISVTSLGKTAQNTVRQSREAGAKAIDEAKEVASDVREHVSALIGTAGDQVTAAAEAQKDGLADRLDDLAEAVHRSGEQLEGHQDWAASLVERGADELSTLAQTLRSNDLKSLFESLGGLARRQPALFLGASVAAGFALSRIARVAFADAPPSVPSPEGFTGNEPVPQPSGYAASELPR